jgi:hypothetical protein
MKAKELAEKLLENPDFDVEFLFIKYFETDEWTNNGVIRTQTGKQVDKYKNVDIEDIGYSDRVIILTGEAY